MSIVIFFFFFNDPATTEIYTVSDTLSLHDALPICSRSVVSGNPRSRGPPPPPRTYVETDRKSTRLNSSHLTHLVCRLLLEKKKKKNTKTESQLLGKVIQNKSKTLLSK